MKNIIKRYSDYRWAVETNDDGGFAEMVFGYLNSWLGPVLEINDLTDDKTALSPILNSITHIQNIIFPERHNYTDNDEIKKTIMKYGAVGTSLYQDSAFLNGNSYYYYGSASKNHAVTIVGWDDDYSADNFYYAPPGNGAWIAKNSWGPDWGENGFYYVSYYDTKFAVPNFKSELYTFVFNDTIKLDKNYQYDITGMSSFYKNGRNELWYKNIFTATDNELLTAVSTYFDGLTNWEISIFKNNVLHH